MSAPTSIVRAARTVAGLLAVAAAAIWDEVIFAAPILVLTARFGPWITLAFLTPTYWVIGSALSLLIARIRSNGEPGRFMTTVQGMEERTRDSKLRRQLVAGSILGFFLSSWILGGILTSYILTLAGLRIELKRWIIAANAIWAVMFIAQYAGIGAILF